MKLRALAKINLGLDVTGKREDGYHEVRMVMPVSYTHLDVYKRQVLQSANYKEPMGRRTRV